MSWNVARGSYAMNIVAIDIPAIDIVSRDLDKLIPFY